MAEEEEAMLPQQMLCLEPELESRVFSGLERMCYFAYAVISLVQLLLLFPLKQIFKKFRLISGAWRFVKRTV